MNFKIQELHYDAQGLLPAIVQDAATLEVLTLAYMNAESLARTIETKETWFWSRSRNQLWHKGETSGNTQRVQDIFLDCDQDALVLLVEPAGPACHTGERTCFHSRVEADSTPGTRTNPDESVGPVTAKASPASPGGLLTELYELIETRRQQRPSGSYTTYLFNEGLDKILKKLGEEAAETIIAAKNAELQPLIGEVADLLFHLLVLLVERGVPLEAVRLELERRKGQRRA